MHPLLIKTTSLSVQTEYFLFYLIVLRCCLMHLIIQSCLLKSFVKALILLTQITNATLQLIWNCKNPFNSPDVEEIHNCSLSLVCLVQIIFPWSFWRIVTLNFLEFQLSISVCVSRNYAFLTVGKSHLWSLSERILGVALTTCKSSFCR